ncbi:MAG: hypothetical protein QNK03_02795 [Myxococcota bacterium]|nr:hypothetical protein [Myxococcota bacterium]
MGSLLGSSVIRRGFFVGCLGVVCVGVLAAPARAFEFFDGRLAVHGFYETQIRALGNNLSTDDGIDLSQWYHVLNIEAELFAIEDGWGPIDLASLFVRVEARYDCAWNRACWLFKSANLLGDRQRSFPERMNDAKRSGFQGSVFVADQGPSPLLATIPARPPKRTYSGSIVNVATDPRNGNGTAVFARENENKPLKFLQIRNVDTLFTIAGPDGNFEGGGDDPAFFYFDRVLKRCNFASRDFRQGDDGKGLQVLGPTNPRCAPDRNGRLRNKPNPFRRGDISPITETGGRGELPFRPAPLFGNLDNAPGSAAQGVYYPSRKQRQLLDSSELNNPNIDFTQTDLEWNRGASQQDEKELREAYADLEFFDSRLWLRLGKQSIVWGKTELFRTTDQFNPVDLALATLPDLEEQRIPQWALRGVWSFWSVGPFQDLRLEVAANFDDFEPNDIGRCGEAYTVNVACNKTTGLFFHGLTGFGLVGEDRPDDPWEDIKGLEVGARVEFRLGRFSMQISNFYGYEDTPYADRVWTYERNVDPFTGRPRKGGARASCVTGTEPACLGIFPFSNITPDGSNNSPSPQNQRAVLDETPINMQLFTMICATSIGFSDLDTSACGQSIFNSLNNVITGDSIPRDQAKSFGGLTVSSLLSNSLAGNATAESILLALTGGVRVPLVPLNADPCDGFRTNGCPAKGDAPIPDFGGHPIYALGDTLNETLTDEQEALLGCGAFYGTDCEVDGIDLANTEGSVFLQSVVGADGIDRPFGWTTTNGLPQPGTTLFQGGPIATRFLGNRTVVMLPGSRGPADDAYDPLVDGCARDTGGFCTGARTLEIPATDLSGNPLQDGGFGASTGQDFASEMAALSWNFQIVGAALSSVPDADGNGAPDGPALPDEFDTTDPYSTDQGQCSWAQPQYCSTIRSFFSVVGAQRNSIRAAGNGTFGRRDFVWHGAGQAVLKHRKRNVLGFSMDFAEDVSKSNWSFEATWIEGQYFNSVDKRDGIDESDTYNLTISIDRPTFINFLNDNRTFFFNTQIFIQYVSDYQKGFTSNGPWNFLATFAVNTGYFRDRLQPSLTFVYDHQSVSAAGLPRITYRFTSNFAATIGFNFFWGQFQNRAMPVSQLGRIDNQTGRRAYRQGVENGLALVRERDEMFLRIRYTF